MTTNKTATAEQGICFTIMPFGGWMDDYYLSIYKPAIEATGLKPKRADDLYRPSQIINDIWDYTKEAQVILADLTGKNPNVFYELGLAHAIAKPVILITETIDDVPFDLRALRVLEYDKNEPEWGKVLQDKIEKAIKETLSNPDKAIPPTFIESKPKKTREPISKQDKDILDLQNQVDLLKKEIRSHLPKQKNIRFASSNAHDSFMQEAIMILDAGHPPEKVYEKLESMGLPTDLIDSLLQDIYLREREKLQYHK